MNLNNVKLCYSKQINFKFKSCCWLSLISLSIPLSKANLADVEIKAEFIFVQIRGRSQRKQALRRDPKILRYFLMTASTPGKSVWTYR